MVGDEVGEHGEILDVDLVAHEDMVAGDGAVEFEAGERGFRVIFVGEVAEKIERAHRR